MQSEGHYGQKASIRQREHHHAERARTVCASAPAVIFGSDGVDGCAHAVFEILSNAIDEAREGYGKRIIVTRFADGSIEVEDFGRGMPGGL